MNNLIKIMCVGVMLSGTALAQDYKIDGKTDKDRSKRLTTVLKVDGLDLSNFKGDDTVIVQGKGGKKAVFKLQKFLNQIDPIVGGVESDGIK